MEPDFQKAYILWDAFPQTVPAAAKELMRRQVMPLSSDDLGTIAHLLKLFISTGCQLYAAASLST